MKSDVWLEIDPHSGNKVRTIGTSGIISAICPVTETHTGNILIARTG